MKEYGVSIPHLSGIKLCDARCKFKGFLLFVEIGTKQIAS
jgi:hypothetical protein